MEEQNTTGRAKRGKGPAKRTPSIEIKLSAGDYIKFSELCRLEKKNRTEVARAAILRYIDGHVQAQEDEARDRLAAAIEAMQTGHKKDTERLAKMIARVMMDIGTVQQVFYDRASKEDRAKLWEKAKTRAADRLAHKRKDGDPEATEIMNHALYS